MSFDPMQLADFAEREIRRFAKCHADETFYGFAIDASLLCFNSIEKFEISLKEYGDRWPEHYSDPNEIADLKANTGDWEYQGFSDFSDQQGWDEDLYADHYDIGFEDETSPLLATTEYSLAMDAVLAELTRRGVFDLVRKTGDFVARRVEHGY